METNDTPTTAAEAPPATDREADAAAKEKACREPACEEQYGRLPAEAKAAFLAFNYCPFCANELVIQCSACHEQLSDKDYHFCPWCGTPFDR